MCFPVNFAKIWGTLFLQNTSRELLLKMDILQNSCSTEYQAGCMIKIFEKYWLRSSIFGPTASSFNVEEALLQSAYYKIEQLELPLATKRIKTRLRTNNIVVIKK